MKRFPVCVSLFLFAFSLVAQEDNQQDLQDLSRRILTRPLTNIELRKVRDVLLAHKASQLSYLLPQISAFSKLEDYIKAYKKFLSEIPKDYIVFGADAGLSSGLKFCILKPRLSEDPWLFAIAGTENALDSMVDAELGRQQLKDLASSITLFTQAPVNGRNFLASTSVLITGHSLGGALAQAATHEIKRKRLAQNIDSAVKLVTFNSLGGRSLIERETGLYDESLLSSLEVAHYFVRGDMISRVDSHFGSTVEILPHPRKSKYASRPDGSLENAEELLRLHSLDNFYDLLNEGSGYQIRQENVALIPPADTLNNIMKYAWVLGYGNHVFHSFRQLHIVKRLTTELSRVEASDFNDLLRAESIRYLYNVAAREAIILGKSTDTDRLQFLPSLNAQLQRLRNYLDQYAHNAESTTPQ